MPSIHYFPTRLLKSLPDGTSVELCFVLLVDEEMHMTIVARTYELLHTTGDSQVPTHSFRFPPNGDFVSSPMGMAILTGELTIMVEQFVSSEREEDEGKGKGERELAFPLRAGTPLPGVEQVAEEGERAYDYPEEYIEESPKGPPPSPEITATHPPIHPDPQRLSRPSLPPSAPPLKYVSKFLPQPDIRSLTIAERRVRTRLAGAPIAGQTVRFPPGRINVALAEGYGRGTIMGLHL
ncbi:unnamed protein product [Tuber melanosporum]|uniref:(Perigord truffle) hypothetical protein n=1 Tax=Tuber melanosporum (strain Mel28) TaxID=656061 RepID=D5G9T5_TUBMM|nr:uncharacterized protein GSTUM_00005063001 [Tuber melanosporum]CAZ81278.1 unnamed protein product [Tuber melanosporum]